MKRRGISHFLQVVIMIALVSAVGLLLYSGVQGLLGPWTKSPQVLLTGAYKVGNTLYLSIKNTGNIPVNITSMTIYDESGNAIASINSPIALNPAEAKTVSVTPNAQLTLGDVVNILMNLSDGSVIKLKASIE